MTAPPARHSGKARSLWTTYGYTSLFCLAIAILLWLLSPTDSLVQLLVVSFAIGLSVATAFVLLEEPLGRILSPYLAPLPITLAGVIGGMLLGGTLLGDPGYFLRDDHETWALGIFFGVVGFLLVGAYGRMQALRTALAEAEADRLQREKLLLESDLRRLQAQIEPHFLFNTLSNVASMIHDEPARAEAMLTDLTTLLRASLRRTRAPLTSVALELEIVRAYLEIQRVRMGGRLRYHIDVDPGCESLSLPPLLLQPLVENAVVHGVEPQEGPGEVRVVVARSGTGLAITVTDSGPGLQGLEDDGGELLSGSHGGTGIANVLGRLEALYHGQATLRFERRPPHGVTAVLTLPEDPHADRPAG